MLRRVVMLVLLLIPAMADAAPVACTNGVFSVVGRPLIPSRSFAGPDLLTLEEGTIAIASGCPAAPVDILLTPKGTVIRATWTECGGKRRVRLRARIRPNCRAMSGVILAEGFRRPFLAADCGGERCRRPLCGTDDACEPSDFCKKPKGACNARGTCRPRTTGGGCPLYIDPVCGCDGRTYSNECEAIVANANIRHEGECAEPCSGSACANPCSTKADCAAEQFCAREPGHCTEDGVCRARPDACTREYLPVCGCDGETYANACVARTAGTSVAHAGSCRQRCAGIAGIACPENDVCDLDPGGCDIVDWQGTCVAKPDVCPELFQPVCGCDGVTYPNDCQRIAAGAQKDHGGRCRDGL